MTKMDLANTDTQTSIVSSSSAENFTQKMSAFFYRFTVPILLLIFVLGIAVIFSFINYQQNLIIDGFTYQEEALQKAIADNTTISAQQTNLLLTKKIFDQAHTGLEDTFLVLATSLGIYLIIIIFVARKLKKNEEQLQSFVQQLQGMNGALHQEILKRDEMAHKLEDLNDALKYQSSHDALTKLPNRSLFEDRLNAALQAGKRNKRIFAVLFLDLDGFKLINDNLGHDTGDELLKVVSTRLSKVIRGMDTVARLGGDEFAFILTELDKPESAAYAAQRIIKELEAPILVKDHQLNVSVSIGITIYPDDSNVAQMLLKNADIAMYNAKNLGPGHFQFYRENMNTISNRDLLLRNSLNAALQNSTLEIYYQPIIDTQQHAIAHFEALLRWNHPQLGAIPPLEILHTANNLHLHTPLNEWILTNAFKQLKAWQKTGFEIPSICINISASQLEAEDFVKKIQAVSQEYQVDLHKLILEVTESTLIENIEGVIKIFSALNKLGVKIAIDDFGTGYSSLNYLRQLPVQILKIDQSFVKAMHDDNNDTAIIRAIIALAQALNLEVIAEGVETKEQMQILKSLGCNKMQGYLFSKALLPDECVHVVIPSKE